MKRGTESRLVDDLITTDKVQELQMKLYLKAKSKNVGRGQAMVISRIPMPIFIKG